MGWFENQIEERRSNDQQLLEDCLVGGDRNDRLLIRHVVALEHLIDENGIIVKAFDKVKAASNPAQMLGELE